MIEYNWLANHYGNLDCMLTWSPALYLCRTRYIRGVRKSENGVLWRAKKSEIRLKSELSHPWCILHMCCIVAHSHSSRRQFEISWFGAVLLSSGWRKDATNAQCGQAWCACMHVAGHVQSKSHYCHVTEGAKFGSKAFPIIHWVSKETYHLLRTTLIKNPPQQNQSYLNRDKAIVLLMKHILKSKGLLLSIRRKMWEIAKGH